MAIPSLSDPRATEAGLMCSNRTAPMAERETFKVNFLNALDALTHSIARHQYGSAINGTHHSTVYAFAECMKDLSEWDCDVCFAQIKAQILSCLPFQRGIRGGRLFFDGCYLRYDDYNFFNETLTTQDRTVCGNTDYSGNQSVYESNAIALVRNLSVEAPKNNGFIAGFVNRSNVSVYGLGQCWEFVNGSDCERCLGDAVKRIGWCSPKEEGKALNGGCYLRYSTYKFYGNSTNDPPSLGNQGQITITALFISLTLNLPSTISEYIILLYISYSHFSHFIGVNLYPCQLSDHH